MRRPCKVVAQGSVVVDSNLFVFGLRPARGKNKETGSANESFLHVYDLKDQKFKYELVLPNMNDEAILDLVVYQNTYLILKTQSKNLNQFFAKIKIFSAGNKTLSSIDLSQPIRELELLNSTNIIDWYRYIRFNKPMGFNDSGELLFSTPANELNQS